MRNLGVGEKVFLQTSTNRWVCGRIHSLGEREIHLEQTSWIDHTGEYWGDALLKGAQALKWASEYLGEVVINRKQFLEILFMGPSAVLPTQSC